MISQLTGKLLVKELDHVEILTSGGVAYELAVPLGTFETIPRAGENVTLHTHLVVREDGWQLYGFAVVTEKRVFRRLLAATGVGPALALGMLSTLSSERLVRAIRERDVATLMSVPRVGRKKAEQLILDLADKLDDLSAPDEIAPKPGGAIADDAMRALVSLGYSASDAETAVRAALDSGSDRLDAAALIRVALAKVKR
ncbi:MAG: Holliday junction branch migration protein RuvA [Gemmatimonadaceae bacterium]